MFGLSSNGGSTRLILMVSLLTLVGLAVAAQAGAQRTDRSVVSASIDPADSEISAAGLPPQLAAARKGPNPKIRWRNDDRRLAGLNGYPTRTTGISCWGPIQNSYVIVISKPWIYGFNTTAARDYQLVYWRARVAINGSTVYGPLYRAINWIPEGQSAWFYEPDPSFTVAAGATDIRLAVVHEYWWLDYHTGQWHYDFERDYSPVSC